MERETFARRLHEAAVLSRDFAGRLVTDSLPNAILFRVLLNQSHDEHPLHSDEKVYPEEGSRAQVSEKPYTEDETVELLWRDGAVPEWVDLSVIGVVSSATLVEARCCGRFTSNEDLLYDQTTGVKPFHVQSPPLPPEYKEGQRFSLDHRLPWWRRMLPR